MTRQVCELGFAEVRGREVALLRRGAAGRVRGRRLAAVVGALRERPPPLAAATHVALQVAPKAVRRVCFQARQVRPHLVPRNTSQAPVMKLLRPSREEAANRASKTGRVPCNTTQSSNIHPCRRLPSTKECVQQ